MHLACVAIPYLLIRLWVYMPDYGPVNSNPDSSCWPGRRRHSCSERRMRSRVGVLVRRMFLLVCCVCCLADYSFDMSDGKTWPSRRLSRPTLSTLGFQSPLQNPCQSEKAGSYFTPKLGESWYYLRAGTNHSSELAHTLRMSCFGPSKGLCLAKLKRRLKASVSSCLC